MEALEDRCLLSFVAPVDYAVGAGPQAVVAGDFNNDGRPDLAVANYNGNSVSVLRGNGDGTFQPAVAVGTGSGPHALAVGDFNGDGRLDLATANDLQTISVLLGNGDGTFGAKSDTHIGSFPVALAAGNLNGDNRTDLVVNSYNGVGYINVLLSNGDGTFALELATQTGEPRGLGPIALADVNADGRQDVVTTETIYYDDTYAETFGVVLLGNGDGTLQPAAGSLFAAYSPFNENMQVSIAVTEFNGDGKPDLAIKSEGLVGIMAGNGDGTFAELPTRSAAWYGPLAAADFDGDGNADLATTANVLLGKGDGTLQPQIRYSTGGWAVAAADFNGDGRPDVAVVYSNLSVFINDGNWLPTGPSIIITDAWVMEGNTGTRAINFTVSMSNTLGEDVNINYSTADGSATANSDYQSTSGTLTIPAGQTMGTITILVNGDRLGEPNNETFFVNLSTPTNAVIHDGQGVGTIVDDEPRISISDFTKAEGKKGQTTLFTFTVTLSAAYDQTVTMSYRTVNGTATMSDQDYVAKTGTLTFAPGETTKTITIEVKGDSKKEANETFYLDLFGNSSNSLFTRNRGLGTILNDD